MNTGDQVGQIIFEKIKLSDFKKADELTCTKRGEKGFDSTGR